MLKRKAIGSDYEDRKDAVDAELQSLRDSGAIQEVDHVPHSTKPLPRKMVTTLKPITGSTMKKKKATVCVCGNFQAKNSTELLYTANSDVSSIRAVLAEAAQHP